MTRSIPELYDSLLEQERILVDVLRQIVIETLPSYCKEKLSYGVPYFYGNRGICIIWPASVPRGGIKSGVLFGFSHGNKLNDEDQYLIHGNNKQVFYRIYQSPEEIDQDALIKLLKEALRIDGMNKGKIK